MIKPLIYNSDIKAIKKKAESSSISVQEASLLKQASWSELTLQQACKNLFRHRFKDAKFIQTDNARSTKLQRMRSGIGGYEEGATDVYLVGKNKKIAFVEFKRIGTPSQIKPTEKQLEMHEFLKNCGFEAYFCNNLVYFEDVICESFLHTSSLTARKNGNLHHQAA